MTAPKKKTVKKKVAKKRGNYKATAPKKRKEKGGGNRGARKLVLTKGQIATLETAAAVGCTYKEMSSAIGVDQDTLRRCRDEQSGVQKAIDDGKAKGCIKAKNKLYAVATSAAPSKFKQVNLNALVYFMNNNTEFSTQLELNEGTAIPKDVDVNDDEAVATYLNMIKKPS